VFHAIDPAGRRLGTVYIRSDLGGLSSRLSRFGLILLAVLLLALAGARCWQHGCARSSPADLAPRRGGQRVASEKNYAVRASRHAMTSWAG